MTSQPHSKHGNLRRHIRGGRSHFVWQDDRLWGDRSPETYFDALTRYCREKPDSAFLDIEGDTLTYAELNARSLRLAQVLRECGASAGDRVSVLLDNSVDMVLSLVATNRLGAIWVPINTAYRGEFLRHQLADSGAAFNICDRRYVDNLSQVIGELPELKIVLVRNWDAQCQAMAAGPSMMPFDVAPKDRTAHPSAAIQPDDISCIIYTSGSTGPSKGCAISHNYLASIGRRRNVSVTPVPGDITWSCLPLFHIASLGAILIANLLVGERVSIGTHFSVSRFWDEIERSGATSVLLLASMFPLLAQAPTQPAMVRCRGQLRVVTGVPLSEKDRRTWEERFGVAFMNSYSYGQTEANVVTLLAWGEPPPPFGSMGPASADFDLMVAGDDQRPVAIGAPGELLLRPRQPGVMFSGYWCRAEATLEASRDLWWHTGDMVRMDENGYLYFVDRMNDCLRSRGENISSFEVESAMMKHPAVLEVAFHSVRGEAGLEMDIKATFVLKPGAEATEQALFEWAQLNLPYFAVPRFIELRDALPKTPTGKIQKNVLRDEATRPGTWDSIAAGFSTRRVRASAKSADGAGS